jgi:Phosphotransferase enzyme family
MATVWWRQGGGGRCVPKKRVPPGGPAWQAAAVSTEETPFVSWGGGAASKARRREDVVLRTAGPWSRSVMALLRHLADAGFAGAPRPVGDGFAPDGREALTYIPGTSPHPAAWDDDAIAVIGGLLRQVHDAGESFRPPADATWQPALARSLPGRHPAIGHGDLGPWNVVARAGVPVAFIDWEFAGPVDARWELAEAAWLNAQLHDDDVAERAGLPAADDRARQVRLFLDGYGLPAAERTGFVDAMIEFAVHSARHEAVRCGVTPDTTAAVDPAGYPVLWAVTWRARSASWMLRHRQVLERALA